MTDRCLQSTPKHIQQIATIAQWDRQHASQVADQHLVTVDAVGQGGDCTRVSRPGIKEPGAPEGAPRTAAITQDSKRKKSAD